jgi:hypothetical protein
MEKDDDSWIELTGEILAYLSKHPDASDTPEGIALWWMKRQRYEASLKQVSLALEELERQGVLDKTVLTDGTPLYGLSLSLKPTEPLEWNKLDKFRAVSRR